MENKPFVHALSDVHTTRVGARTKIWQFCVILAQAEIGADCNICSHVFIENDVKIGHGVTVKNGARLFDGLRLEDGVFIGPNVAFANDMMPRSKRYPDAFPRTVVKAGASIGAGAVILPGLTIGEGAMIGAGAIVSKDVAPHSLVRGDAARERRKLEP